MKIKDFRINSDVMPFILGGTVLIGSIVGGVLYGLYENQHQVYEQQINSNEIYTNENGEYCHYFEPGEHVIEISRNDPFYHKVEQVEGYEIKEVEINGWRYNNKTIYVNTEPVIVVSHSNDKEKIEFNDFGEVQKEQVEKKFNK